MQQSTKEKEGKKETGRWSSQEHQRFMLGIFQYGKDWKKVQQVVATRSGSQVRSHAQKFFNRLQKEQKNPNAKKDIHKESEMSQTENDLMKVIQDEQSLNTPMELVTLIRQQSKDDRTVHVNSLMKKLQTQGDQLQKQQVQKRQQKIEELEASQLKKPLNSFKSMQNILDAYQTTKKDEKSKQYEDQSFLLYLTKKYKKYFSNGAQFLDIVDVKNQIIKAQPAIRKRSFTLLEGQQSDDQKLQFIRKKIKAQEQKKQKQVQKQQNINKINDEKVFKNQNTQPIKEQNRIIQKK